MKKTGLLLVTVLLAGITHQAHAQDGFFSDAQTLRSNQLALGVQPVIFTEIDDFLLNLRAAYGLQPGLTVHGKVGILADETYIGGHFEYRLAGEPQSSLSVALLGGVYSFGDLGLKISGVVSKRLEPFSIYTGISYEPLFAETTVNPVLLPVGVDIPLLTRKANFVLEGDIALGDDGELYQAVIFGINFYL